MSKSTGNVVDPFDMANAYGLDPMRYFFLREVPFGNDGSYSHEAIVARINADLANGLGNLAQRTLSMIAKNCEGRVPDNSKLTDTDEVLLKAAYGIHDAMAAEMADFKVHRALEAIWNVVGEADKYIAEQAPWALKKTDPERMNAVLYTAAETVRVLAVSVQPFMPDSAAKLLDLLAVPVDKRAFTVSEAALVPGTELPPPQGVFPRYVEPAAE